MEKYNVKLFGLGSTTPLSTLALLIVWASQSLHAQNLPLVGHWENQITQTTINDYNVPPRHFVLSISFGANGTYVYEVRQLDSPVWLLSVVGSYSLTAAPPNNYEQSPYIAQLFPSVQGFRNPQSASESNELERLAYEGYPTNVNQSLYVSWDSQGTLYLKGSELNAGTFSRVQNAPYSFNYPVVWRPSEGVWYSRVPTGATSQAWGLPGDVPVRGDYDGDGYPDDAIWRPTTGQWFIPLSSTGQPSVSNWGLPGDIPLAGDYDGDQKTDRVVWRPSNGTWYILNSATGSQTVQQWGLPGDIPVPGDFDGDGKRDCAIWRPSTGEWWVRLSSTGAIVAQQWGLPGDIPVPGDFDGDGITDYAVWRPSSGEWWVILSSTNQEIGFTWGLPGDIPIRGDFNGDGKADYTVFRPSTGEWWINYGGTTSFSVFDWGLPGDFPIGQTLVSAPPGS